MRSMKIVGMLFALVVAVPVAAQSYMWGGVASTQPQGDSKAGLKSGYLAELGFGKPLGETQAVSLQVAGYYGSNDLKAVTTSIDLMGASVGLGYTLVQARISPYILANAGILRSESNGTADTNPMYQFGVGAAASLSPKVSLFGEVRYLSTTGDAKLELMPIAVGLVWMLGGN